LICRFSVQPLREVLHNLGFASWAIFFIAGTDAFDLLGAHGKLLHALPWLWPDMGGKLFTGAFDVAHDPVEVLLQTLPVWRLLIEQIPAHQQKFNSTTFSIQLVHV